MLPESIPLTVWLVPKAILFWPEYATVEKAPMAVLFSP